MTKELLMRDYKRQTHIKINFVMKEIVIKVMMQSWTITTVHGKPTTH